jgi:methionyl-tRNA formyltransferase
MTAESSDRPPVRTVFLGSGTFAVPILRSVAAHPLVDLVGVVTAPPSPAGRRQELDRTAVHAAADVLGTGPILTPARLRDQVAIDDILALDPELLVLADYGRIVPSALLDPPYGALNLHPSLLPRHRGASPIPATILAGDATTGVTLMRMDAGLDTGPIIAQSYWALDGDESTPELEVALAEEGASLVERSIGPWLAGDLSATPQSSDGATLTRPLRREDGRLDARRPAAELERQVRALQPWPGTFVDLEPGRLRILAAAAEPGSGTTAGVIDERGLATPDGRLRLHEVQPAGGRPMSWDAYVRGRPSIIGSRVAKTNQFDLDNVEKV